MTESSSATRAKAAHGVAGGYIPGFDGLRAIAILMVLVAHAGFGEVVPGGLGVTVFFAVSGYLITTLLIGESAKTGTIELPKFYVRRFLRLYPELLVLIALCLLAGLFLPFTATVPEKLAGLFYYMNYYHIFGAQYTEANTYPWRQLWSLSVEEHFYFIFPALMLIFRRRQSRLVAVWALVLLPCAWRLVTYYVIGLPWQYNYLATDTRIDSIAWGCLLSLLLHREDGVRSSPQAVRFIAPPVVALALALMAATLLWRTEDFRWTWRFTLQGVAIVLLIANILFDPRWRPVVAILEWAPIRYVGRISYGLYLYHLLVIYLILRWWPTMPRTALLATALGASLVAASASYLLVETPLKSVRRRFGSAVR